MTDVDDRPGAGTTPKISIITPTTGAEGLFRLIDSIRAQGVAYEHILLWDGKRDGRFGFDWEGDAAVHGLDVASTYSIVIPGRFIQSRAAGSALRAVGLMAAQGDYVTFADSDVWYEPGHLKQLLNLVQECDWGFCRRRIWTSDGRYLGVDNFESVGDSPDRKVDYVLVDNNTMIFARHLGVAGAAMYRQTTEYNDDRLMTGFLYAQGGNHRETDKATINQVCPAHLEQMFEANCDR